LARNNRRPNGSTHETIIRQEQESEKRHPNKGERNSHRPSRRSDPAEKCSRHALLAGECALKITIETETPNDSGSMFRVLLDDKPIGADLTAVQSQIVAAEIIERFVLRRRPKTGSAKIISTPGLQPRNGARQWSTGPRYRADIGRGLSRK
jgi:hypothetical protein